MLPLKIALVAALAFTGLGCAVETAEVAAHQQAVAALDNGDPAGAVVIMEGALGDPTCCGGAFYYNLGVAHSLLDQHAQALAALLAARYALPRDHDVQHNLRLLSQRANQTVPRAREYRATWQQPLFWLDWFNAREHWYGAIILTGASLYLLVLLIWRSQFPAFATPWLVLCLGAVIFWIAFAVHAREARRWGVSLAEVTEVYSGPSRAGHQQLFQLSYATPLALEEQESNWYRVRTRDGRRGWVASEDVTSYQWRETQ